MPDFLENTFLTGMISAGVTMSQSQRRDFYAAQIKRLKAAVDASESRIDDKLFAAFVDDLEFCVSVAKGE